GRPDVGGLGDFLRHLRAMAKPHAAGGRPGLARRHVAANARRAYERQMKTGSRGAGRAKIKKSGLKASSREWLTRQLNDPYVHAAKREGYRSRAAFKLLELDGKFHFLKKGARVLDLGSAPGGWSQVAAAKGAQVVAADVLEMESLPGVTFFQADLTDADVPAMLIEALGGPADLVMTDMAGR